MELIIGLDLGTTNCKAMALALDSSLAGSAEQSAEELWQGVLQVLRSVAQKANLRHDVIGLCLSGAMHSLRPVEASDALVAGVAMLGFQALSWAASLE